MKLTDYAKKSIEEHGVTVDQVEEALNNEVARQVQEDGRIRVWGWVDDLGFYVRVILLSDGETLPNAFRDSNFTRKRKR
ncbi:MAG: hypothetical protein BRD52_07245 [Bacteroidetes bacterium SW_4_67_19]|jgi:hydrogenase maturation factor HypE|nr:MAG: hypothetical protein BRD52_07245 [Bacteroidetes bacterium SW_4_67_19]